MRWTITSSRFSFEGSIRCGSVEYGFSARVAFAIFDEFLSMRYEREGERVSLLPSFPRSIERVLLRKEGFVLCIVGSWEGERCSKNSCSYFSF